MAKTTGIENEKSEKQFLSISFEPAVLKRIEDFRFKYRFNTRTDAIRWLLQAALDEKLTPER